MIAIWKTYTINIITPDMCHYKALPGAHEEHLNDPILQRQKPKLWGETIHPVSELANGK